MKILRDNIIAITALLSVLVLGKLSLVKYLLVSNTIGPLVLNDELIYKVDAMNIFHRDAISTTHYPPLYPLLLSFAFYSKDHWYAWMLFINVFLSSLVLIPVWLISLRFLPRTTSLAVVLITALSSFQVYYPRLVMSENLHVPLFLFSIFLLMGTDTERGMKSIIVNTLFGISMAFGYLTKYLYLVAIPILILLWWVKPFFNNDPEHRSIINSSRLLDFLAVSAGLLLTYVPWLIYVQYSGIPVMQGMGAHFVRSGIRDFATLKSLALWINFYLSYSILALAPFLLGFSLYLLMQMSGRIKNDRQEMFFMVTVMLLSAMYLVTAIQHSWRAGYNYPVPQKVMGRYVMHVIPLWLIAFMIALSKIKAAVGRVKLSQIIFCSLMCLAAMFFALVMLILVQDAKGLEFSFMNSPDGVMFTSKPFVLFFFIIFLTMAATLSAARRYPVVSKRLIIFFSFLLLLIQISSSYKALEQTLNQRTDYQLHARPLSQFVQQEINANHEKITMISDDTEFHSRWLPPSIAFWLSDRKIESPITFISLKDYLSHDRWLTENLFIITRDYSGNPLYQYTVKGQSYYIYDVAHGLQKSIDLKPLRRYAN